MRTVSRMLRRRSKGWPVIGLCLLVLLFAAAWIGAGKLVTAVLAEPTLLGFVLVIIGYPMLVLGPITLTALYILVEKILLR